MTINAKEILEAANMINETFKQGEKFAIPLLAVKAQKTALANPTDQPIRVIANVLNKMSENGKVFISRAEFNSVCSKIGIMNSVATDCFANELDLPKEKEDRPLAGMVEETKYDLYAGANESIANALSGMWDENGKIAKAGEYKMYNPTNAKQAEVVTNLELNRLGIGPKAINTFAGTKEFIICDATYATPKGDSHVLIPVQLSKSGALIPRMFASKYGFVDLTREALSNHIQSTAGKSFHVDSDLLLNTLSIAKEASVMDPFEIQALALQESINGKKIKKEASDNNSKNVFAANNIFYKEVEEIKPENVELKMPKAAGYDEFSKKLGTTRGTAEFVYGKETIDNGRNIIIAKMAEFGYRPQVSVSSCDDCGNVTYAVRIDQHSGPIGFEVIAEVNDGKVTIQSIVAVADKAYEFTKVGIDQVVRANNTDYRMVAAVSPMYDLKPSEILDTIKEAADCGDYKTAEEALHVLNEKSDHETYAVGLQEYMRCVNAGSKPTMTKTASKKCGCKLIVKNANHTGPVCGHLNLPLDQVYQNEHGECCPLYRRSMKDTYEGVLFNTSKIFG